MMSIETSRTAEPVTDRPRGGAMGTWGLWLGLVVLAMFVAGLATAALYLETTQPAWPPEGMRAPGRGWAMLAVALTAIGATSAALAQRRMRAADPRSAALHLIGAGALLTGAVATLVADLRAVDFRWDAHSYASVHWTLTGFTITFLAVGVLMVAAVLVQTVTGLVDEHRHLELTNTVITLVFILLTSVVLLALVHGLPLVGGDA